MSEAPKAGFGEDFLHAEDGRSYNSAYSRFVQAMKVVLPLGAAVLIALVAAWPHLRPKEGQFQIGFANVATKSKEEPSLVNARFHGADKNRQPFTISADIARNVDPKKTKPVELEMPKADIALEDGAWMALTAESGVYLHKENKLSLVGAVSLFHDSGYEFHTEKALIDLEESVAKGDVPIRGHGSFGEVEGEGFQLLDQGKTMVLTGKSRVLLYPHSKEN